MHCKNCPCVVSCFLIFLLHMNWCIEKHFSLKERGIILLLLRFNPLHTRSNFPLPRPTPSSLFVFISRDCCCRDWIRPLTAWKIGSKYNLCAVAVIFTVFMNLLPHIKHVEKYYFHIFIYISIGYYEILI